MCKMFPPVYNGAKIVQIIKIFQSYDYKCSATFLWFKVYFRSYNYDVLLPYT